MVTPLIVSPDQLAVIEEVKAMDARFGADPTSFHSNSAIAAAKALIEKTIDAGLDERIYHPLQIWISLHDNEQSLPEHLRQWQPKP